MTMYQFTRNFQDASAQLALGDSFALGDTASSAAAYFATRPGAAALFTKVLELKDAYQMPGKFPATSTSQMWDFANDTEAASMLAWWVKNNGTRQKLVDAIAYSDISLIRGFSAPTYQNFVNVIATQYPRLYTEAAAALGYQGVSQAAAAPAQYNASTGQINTDAQAAAKKRLECKTGDPFFDIPCQIEKLGTTVKYVAMGAAALGAAYVATRVYKAFRRP